MVSAQTRERTIHMADIRGFFGGGGPAPTKKSPGKKSASAPAEDVIEGLEDSDEEQSKKVQSRKRLKSGAASPSPVKSKESQAKQSPVKGGEAAVQSSGEKPNIFEILEAEDNEKLAKASVKKAKMEPIVLSSPSGGKGSESDPVNLMPNDIKPISLLDQNVSIDSKSKILSGVSDFFGAQSNMSSAPQKRVASAITEGKSPKKVSSPSPKKKKGSIVEPDPNAGPLTNKKFVVTGEFDTSGIGREGIEDLVKEHGGIVQKNVSGKTTFLITGEYLKDGFSKAMTSGSSGRPVNESSKYKDAVEKNVAIIDEEKFMKMVPERKVIPKKASSESSGQNSSSSSSAPFPAKREALSSSSNNNRPATSTDDLLWVDKYKPAKASQIVGGDTSVRNLSQWLQRWDAVHLHKTQKAPSSAKENSGAKAVLLSGPPGIGKTTMATLLGKEAGYEVLELNASDTRSQKSVSQELGDVVLSRAIGFDGQMNKRLVIMDEVDGMGGSDRGGIPELIKIIKTAKSPIVCICNDRQAQKIKTLANHCYDLRIKRPIRSAIASRLVEIGRLEGLLVEPNAAEMMVEQCGNDIRQAIHAMQMWRAQSSTMKYTELKAGISRIEKDKILRQSPFDSCLTILEGGVKGSTFEDRTNSYFTDYSLVPLLIQQNYIENARSGVFKNPHIDECAKLDKLAQAADAVADMELAGATIMGVDQHWELLPIQAAFATKVGSYTKGWMAFPQFPAWLGKYSTTNKMKRLTSELVNHTMLKIGQGFTAIRQEYVPYLRAHLLQPLREEGQEAIQKVIQILDEYGLSKDDFMESMKDLQFISANTEKDPKTGKLTDKIHLPDNYGPFLDTKLKTSLTRTYNQGEHRSQALVALQAAPKKKKASNTDSEIQGTTEDLEATKVDEVEDEDDSAAALAGFAKKKTAKKGPAKKKAKK